MKEIWKDIKNYEGLYQVSNKGRIKSLDRYVNYKVKGKKRLVQGKIKKLTVNEKGYLKVTLFKNGKGETREVQRFVAEAFIPNPENKPQVNHINGDKTDNKICNLEFCTCKENSLHSLYVLKNNIKQVKQYDLSGNYIRTFESVKEAGEKTNTPSCSISNVLHGRRNKAGGFVWRAD